jgi:cytoskeleton protein RodZ
MPESFGARLRQQREDKQIALTSIADQTKIKLSLLEALERDDVSQWPSGIFRRAYLRTYAHVIGLEPDDVLREFLELYPEPADMFPESVETLAADDPSRRTAPPTRLRTMMDSAIESIVKLRRPPAGVGAGAGPAAPATPFTAAHSSASAPAILGPDTIYEEPPAAAAPPLAPDGRDGHTNLESAASPMEPPKERVVVRVHAPAALSAVPLPVPGSESMVDEPVAAPAAPIADRAAPPTPQPPVVPQAHVDLEGVAALCTSLGRVFSRNEVQRLLGDAARILSASGLIVWLWDEIPEELRPALTYGYSDQVLAQLPIVKQDADNPTAAAFRSCEACEMPGSSRRSGALVVPMLSVEGCAGVLAIELQPGVHPKTVRPVAAIIAAALTQLTLRSLPAEALPVERMAAVASFRAPSRPVRVRR